MSNIMSIAIEEKISFGERLLRLRKDRRLTLEQLAKLCHLSGGHLSAIERSIDNPSMKSAIKIATGLGLSYEQFMDGVDASKIATGRASNGTAITRPVLSNKDIFVRVSTAALPELLSQRGITFEKQDDGYYSLKFKMSEKMMALKFINEMLWSAQDV